MGVSADFFFLFNMHKNGVFYGTPSLSYNAVYALYGMVISIYDVVT